MQEVSGSIPLGSTIFAHHQPDHIVAALTGRKWWSQAATPAPRNRRLSDSVVAAPRRAWRAAKGRKRSADREDIDPSATA